MGYKNQVLTHPLSPLPLFLAEEKCIELDQQDKKSKIFC